MAHLTAESLEGDGINLPFFHLLWNKANEEESSSFATATGTCTSSASPLRVPDTVVFQFGQPLYWYFTSKRGGKDGKSVTILRKRKQNVTVEKIEELFLKKASTRGTLGKHDVVAYFIASVDCTSRFRRQSANANDEGMAAAAAAIEEVASDAQCDIEYFDRDGLRKFLESGRKNQTGILQRFVQPTGGGTHNTLIQAIWTPNLCLMERRRTKQSLHDIRFGLYERTVTFEGPDVHSTSKPVRGTVLGNKIKQICNDIVHHVSEVTGEGRKRSRSGSRARNPCTGKLDRMVLYFKVDINDDIWVLFTSSLRLDGTSQQHLTNFSQPWNLSEESKNSGSGAIAAPLNIDTVVKLGPTIKLNPNANHDPSKVLENEITLTYCPSCGLDVTKEHFYPVPYKTIISHFEHAVDMIKNELGLERLIEWPPDEQLIKAAGGVGFGSYVRNSRQVESCRNGKAVSELPEEDTIIPPVIRQLHARLKAQGYRRYRNDPLFLHKNCNVCEQCFLAYAQLSSSSFTMINPVRLDEDGRKERIHRRQGKKEEEKEAFRRRPEANEESKSSGWFDMSRSRGDGKKSIGMLLPDAPSLPPVIIEPPSDSMPVNEYRQVAGGSGGAIGSIGLPTANAGHPYQATIRIDDFLSKQKESSHYSPQPEEVNNPLQHLISSYELMQRANIETTQLYSQSDNTFKPLRAKKQNPYEEEQKIVEPKGYVAAKTNKVKKKAEGRSKNTSAQQQKGGGFTSIDVISSKLLDLPVPKQERVTAPKVETDDQVLLMRNASLDEIYDQERKHIDGGAIIPDPKQHILEQPS